MDQEVAWSFAHVLGTDSDWTVRRTVGVGGI